MKLKVGDRVTADVGAGPQAGKIVGRWALGYMVLFDVAPPREYNMGENPTAMLPSFLGHAQVRRCSGAGREGGR